MKDYNFICNCNLKHKVSIDEVLLGKQIPLKIFNKYYGYVLFPVVDIDNNCMNLLDPPIEGQNIRNKRGDYSYTFTPSGQKVLYPTITGICFAINLCEDVDDSKIVECVIKEIEKYTSKFIKCIGVLHQSIIKWSYSNEDGYVEPIMSYEYRGIKNKKWKPLISVNILLNINPIQLSTSDFWNIYRGLDKNITLQNELLSDVYRCIKRNEYREAVLNCAIIIEKTLKEQISLYLDKENVSVNIKKYILKQVDGFRKIVGVIKDFEIPMCNSKNSYDGTMGVRNRIIHGGYIPTKEEVEQAIIDAKSVMEFYKVQFFMD